MTKKKNTAALIARVIGILQFGAFVVVLIGEVNLDFGWIELTAFGKDISGYILLIVVYFIWACCANWEN